MAPRQADRTAGARTGVSDRGGRVPDADTRGGMSAGDAADTSDSVDTAPPGEFRRTLVRVMTMQVVTLALLWLLQEWFGR